MRKLLTTTFLTLDGVMQAPGGPEEDPSDGFAFGGWSVSYWDDGMGDVMNEIMGKPFDLVLGRKTYDIFAAYWPNQTDPTVAGPLNAATKYVASRSRPTLSWDRSVQLNGDVADALRELKAGDGPELQVHGSGNLIQTLLQNNLIDELHLWQFPVLLGQGKRLFADGTMPAGLKLIDAKISTTGVVIGTYVPVGEVKTGTFAP